MNRRDWNMLSPEEQERRLRMIAEAVDDEVIVELRALIRSQREGRVIGRWLRTRWKLLTFLLGGLVAGVALRHDIAAVLEVMRR
ncbi:MAG: hypothetical protein ACE37J_13765 [Pikeienuella sp.]|uniref:hypothetical protein n=1 Tax=Pikeienuella sp. TaxID=2831957 RepID=UPI00391B29EF